MCSLRFARLTVTDGSCAIGCCEPCQVGDQAALSSFPDVPQGCLSRVGGRASVHKFGFDITVYGLIRALEISASGSSCGDPHKDGPFFTEDAMYRALYRKYRPYDFDDVWGQEQVTDILKYEVANGKINHAYLFCGSRGTGKTSSAKILAKAVNCLSPKDGNPCNRCAACRSVDEGTATDVVEMDAASNTGVNDVRDIRDEIVFTPAELRYRVYIIDEVHMMSGSAFNALLKTLEEPPSHVIFILATTELHKLPSTIVSRCQRFDFKRISNTVLSKRLLYIAQKEDISLTEGGARLLARLAFGGMRDAISLLELCAGKKETIDEALVASTCGAGDKESIYRLIEAVQQKDYDTLYGKIHELTMSSRDISVFWQDLIDCYRDMMVLKTAKNGASYLDLTDSETERLTALAAPLRMEQMIYHTGILEDALSAMLRSPLSRRALAELALTRLCEPQLSTSPESLVLRISELERRLVALQSGIPTPAPAASSKAEEGGAPSPERKEPAPKREAAPAPSEEKAPTQPTEKGPLYRPFAAWREVMDELIRAQRSLAGTLKGSSAFLSGEGDLLIRVGNPFFVGMLQSEGILASIRASASMIAGITVRKIHFETEDAPSGHTIIDELEAALKDK